MNDFERNGAIGFAEWLVANKVGSTIVDGFLQRWVTDYIQEQYEVKWSPIQKKNVGDLILLEEFYDTEEGCYFDSDDGHGVFATETQQSNISCWDYIPEKATHVLWYNK